MALPGGVAPDGLPGILIALREVQWMARRGVSSRGDGQACSSVNAATWMLEVLLARHGIQPCRPDEEDQFNGVAASTLWADGTSEFSPTASQREAWIAMGLDGQVSLIVEALCGWAAVYAREAGAWSESLWSRACAVLGSAGYEVPRVGGESRWFESSHG